MSVVVYVSHPIGEGDRADLEKRSDNIANAGEWMRFFINTTRWVMLCPWYVYAITHGDQIHAPRRLIDQLATLERCDLLVLCGGFMSPHMRFDVKSAKRHGIPIVDLTPLGVVPPATSEDNAQVVMSRAHRMIRRNPRRICMPLLTEPDIDHLKKARHALDTHLTDEHDVAVAVLDRIIQAATDVGEW